MFATLFTSIRWRIQFPSVEGFNSRVRRAIAGVFHYISPQHADLYFYEIGFRWSQRVVSGSAVRKTRHGREIIRTLWSRVPPALCAIRRAARLDPSICVRRVCSWTWRSPASTAAFLGSSTSSPASRCLFSTTSEPHSLSDQQRFHLFETVEERYRRKSTISCPNPVAKWHDLIAGPTVADAILDRIDRRGTESILSAVFVVEAHVSM